MSYLRKYTFLLHIIGVVLVLLGWLVVPYEAKALTLSIGGVLLALGIVSAPSEGKNARFILYFWFTLGFAMAISLFWYILGR